MSWQDRVRATIDFTSPNGDTFSAKWKGNQRTTDKKVAEFDFPDFEGTITQDLGTKSRRFPLTFYFEGENNDKQTKKFESSIKQSGRWTVIHPVIGRLSLQPISITVNDNPTESGNQTEISSEWIEPADDISVQSAQELADLAKQQAENTMANAAGQANANTVQKTAKQTAKTRSAASRTIGSVQRTIKKLVQGSTNLSNQINQIIRSAQDTLDNTVIPMLVLAGQLKELILLPQQISDDFNSRIERYTELFNEILGIEPTGNTEADKNTVAIQEHVLTATVSATALICTNSDFQTKQQAIDAAEKLIGFFNSTTDQLDSIQELFINNDIDLQYFSQSQTFSDLYTLVSTALKYLISSVFNLSVEKRIVLQKPTIPAEVVINEYGTLGENDILLDIFIAINQLKGAEIIVMPAEKEVVLYV